MRKLRQKIKQELRTAKHCAVYNEELLRVWPQNGERITLEKTDVRVPDELPYGNDELVPFRAGETLAWRVVYVRTILEPRSE